MKILSIFLFLLPFASIAQTEVKTFFYDKNQAVPREHNVDISHVLIDISFDPPKGVVRGNVTHTFTPKQKKVDSIFFDAPAIQIKDASLDGKPVKFKTVPEGVIAYPSQALTWDATHKILFNYEAQPRVGLYFVGWNDPANKHRKQIWTQGQAYDNRHWVPLYDRQNDKAITEVVVKFDQKYKVLSNGDKLEEKTNKDGTKTWRYKMSNPHATYLIMLGIGEYEIEKRKSKRGIPVNLWYYPEYKERVSTTYKHSTDMLDWFEKKIGVKYPWNTYSQIPVSDYTFGAMENTTATLFGDFYFVDEGADLDRSYLYVNAHELAHQWFGDLVTERTETHHWLQESFATYYGNLYNGVARGTDYYDWSRKTSIDQALEASKKNNYPVGSSVGGTVRHYPKGAVVLDMLRNVTGDEAFQRAIKYYLEKHAFGNVDSEDLLIAFHEKLGLSLDWFWEQWIYRGGEPRYEVLFREVLSEQGEHTNEFVVTQTHEVNELINYFKMPVDFEVHYKDGTLDKKTATIDKYYSAVQIPNPAKKEVDFVVFDPNMKVMKSTVFVKPYEMLAAQALKGKNMLDRYDALTGLRSFPLSQKTELLKKVFQQETFHATKAEVVAQLAAEINEQTLPVLQQAIKDNDVDVRKSVLSSVRTIPATMLHDFEALLNDKSYMIVEHALDKLVNQNAVKRDEYLAKTKNIYGTRGNNVRIKWLELSAQSDTGHLKELTDMAGPSYEFLTRVAAMGALKRLNHFDEMVVKNLFDGALNSNGKLSADAIAALKYFYGQVAYKAIIDAYYQSSTWENWQKEILGKVFL